MSSPKRVAVILAGCGNKDGSEIQEAVLTLLSIDQNGASYQCFAPNIPQVRVLNFLTNEVLSEKRSVLLESARIARSQIKPLNEFNSSEFDILVIPGGSGVAYNLCSYAEHGSKMTVNEDVKKVVLEMFSQKKPIGALCIAPVILAHVLDGIALTFGPDEKATKAFAHKSLQITPVSAEEIVVDGINKIVTTPCYMDKTHIASMFKGINLLVKKLIELSA